MERETVKKLPHDQLRSKAILIAANGAHLNQPKGLRAAKGLPKNGDVQFCIEKIEAFLKKYGASVDICRVAAEMTFAVCTADILNEKLSRSLSVFHEVLGLSLDATGKEVAASKPALAELKNCISAQKIILNVIGTADRKIKGSKGGKSGKPAQEKLDEFILQQFGKIPLNPKRSNNAAAMHMQRAYLDEAKKLGIKVSEKNALRRISESISKHKKALRSST